MLNPSWSLGTLAKMQNQNFFLKNYITSYVCPRKSENISRVHEAIGEFLINILFLYLIFHSHNNIFENIHLCSGAD